MWLRRVGVGNKKTGSHLVGVIIEAVGMDKITKGENVELELACGGQGMCQHVGQEKEEKTMSKIKEKQS